MNKEDITKKLRNKKLRSISIGVIVCLLIVSMIKMGASTDSKVETPDVSSTTQESQVKPDKEKPQEQANPNDDGEKETEKAGESSSEQKDAAEGQTAEGDKSSEGGGDSASSQSSSSTSQETPKAPAPEPSKPSEPSQPGSKPEHGQEGEGGKKEEPSSGSTEIEKTTIRVTMEIECTSISENKSLITDESILDYVPKDGYILHKKTLDVKPETTAFELTQSLCDANGIALDFSYTPAFGTYYIKGIGYIYEKMAGSQSGWMYMVNGFSPNKGCDSYTLKDGDHVRWFYVTG